MDTFFRYLGLLFIAHVSPTFFTVIKFYILFIFIYLIASRIAITLGVALRETAREKRKIDFFFFVFAWPCHFVVAAHWSLFERERTSERAPKESRLHTNAQTRACVGNKRNNE